LSKPAATSADSGHRVERHSSFTAFDATPPPDWQGDFAPGVDPERRDHASFFDFADPDGTTWVVQERGRSLDLS
jgi:hypothetical protein